LNVVLAPCLTRESRLPTSLLKKLCSIEAMLRCDLGKQESALLFVGDQESVSSNLNLVWADRLGRREKRYFNFEFLEFLFAERGEPRIAKRSAGGTPHKALPKGLLAFDDTDAAT
jgi:hypothetical protein